MNILHRIFFSERFDQFLTQKITLKLRILRCSRRLFIILVSLTMTWFREKCLFPLDTYMVSCPTWSKNLGRTLLKVPDTYFQFLEVSHAWHLSISYEVLYRCTRCGWLFAIYQVISLPFSISTLSADTYTTTAAVACVYCSQLLSSGARK